MPFADASDLLTLAGIGEDVRKEVDEAIRELGAATFSRAQELAHERLHTRLPAFLGALGSREEAGEFLVTLAPPATWIEDGQSAFDMKDALLSSPKARTSKDGTRYLVVPFEHSRTAGPERPIAHTSLGDAIRAHLKQAGVSATRIERGPDGRPRTGLLHRVPLGSPPGPVGASGRPYAQGLSIYQHALPGGGTARSAVTFRVISSKSEGWRHPGNEPAHILRDAKTWAEEEWERAIWPELLERLTGIRTLG